MTDNTSCILRLQMKSSNYHIIGPPEKKNTTQEDWTPSPIQERANVEEMMCSAVKKLKTAFMKKYSGNIRNTDKRGPTKEV
jgi:hypothetical protein